MSTIDLVHTVRLFTELIFHMIREPKQANNCLATWLATWLAKSESSVSGKVIDALEGLILYIVEAL